jgi:hypothetical protein
LSIPFTRKSESKKNGTFSKWRGLEGLKIWAFWKLIGFEPQIFRKELLISQNRDRQPTVNFTGNTMRIIPIDWYQETCIFMLYESMHKRSLLTQSTNLSLSTQSWRHRLGGGGNKGSSINTGM